MKTAPCGEKVTLLKGHGAQHCRSQSVGGPVVLSEDRQLLRLPQIRAPRKVGMPRPRSVSPAPRDSPSATPDRNASTRHEGRDEKKGMTPGLRYEHFPPVCTSSSERLTDEMSDLSTGSSDPVTPLIAKPHEPLVTLKGREHPDAATCRRTQTHHLGSELLLLPSKPRPYIKSHSHREFSVEEKETCLPLIFHSAPRTSPPPYGQGTRASLTVSVLPALPRMTHCHKSISQPDLFNPPPGAATSTDTSATPSPAISPTLARKRRIRDLWQTAGAKLGICMEQVHGDEVPAGSGPWVEGPGTLLRPDYSRWAQRRHALAEPERMCMPQVVRERIQRDVDSRRRSMKRRVSNFLNIKLGLNFEEDLAA